MTRLPELTMHHREHGEAPEDRTAILLHGWPQTAACWEELALRLGDEHRLVAPDLRGYGLSDKATSGFDKRRMAQDIVDLMDRLGLETVHLVGHDRGARVAHRLALDHPARLRSLTVLDIAPTLATFQTDLIGGTGFFHWLLHMQPDLPELLTAGREEQYLRHFFERWTFRRDLIEPKIPEYLRAFRRPGAMRAGFDDYRASRQDLADDEADQQAGRRVTAPTLALWGAEGLVGGAPVLERWRDYVDVAGGTRLEGHALPDCGHFIPEEAPDELAEELRRFWAPLGDAPR